MRWKSRIGEEDAVGGGIQFSEKSEKDRPKTGLGEGERAGSGLLKKEN